MGELACASPSHKRLRSKTPSRPEEPNGCEVCRDAYPDKCHCTQKLKNLSGKTEATLWDEHGQRRPWLRARLTAGAQMVGCFLCSNYMGSNTAHPTGKMHKFAFAEKDRHFSFFTIASHVAQSQPDKGEHAHCLREYMRAVRSSAGSALGEVLVSATEKAQEWRSKQQPTKELLNFACLAWVAIVLPISAAHFVTLSRCTQDINASIPADLWQSQYGFKEWLQSFNIMLLERVRGIFKASRKVAVHIDVVSGYLVIRIKALTASPQPILWRSIPLTHELS